MTDVTARNKFSAVQVGKKLPCWTPRGSDFAVRARRPAAARRSGRALWTGGPGSIVIAADPEGDMGRQNVGGKQVRTGVAALVLAMAAACVVAGGAGAAA